MSLFQVLKFITDHPVNRDQKIKAVMRFVKWQISSRLAPGAIACDWINGAKFLARTGETGLTGNIYAGLHEFPDMGFLLHCLRPEDTFVDIGANVGSYSILAGSVVGAKGHAFEPVPSTYQKLVDNIQLNAMGNRVQALNLGLADAEGQIRFTSDLDTVNHALAKGEISTNTIAVKVTTLDQAMVGIQPNLIKIDVEGYETPVLAGAAQTLRDSSLRAVIMELNGSGNRYGYDESKLLTLMMEAGFKTFTYEPFSRALKSLSGRNQLEGNTLFIRDEVWVRERLAHAQKFKVYGVDV
ncbi:MAG: FkbM family methyltransferase [Aquabacterium sp.]|nr:FkbM family methyltransferase [Aquabacterium sp.]